MTYFLQQVVDGVSTGVIYALLGLAMVLIFRATGIINFAQGELATIAAFFAWQLNLWGLPIWLAIAATAVIGFGAGAAIERVVIRPVANKDHFTLIMVTLGLFMITNAVTGLVWGYTIQAFPDPFPVAAWTVRGVSLSLASVGTIVIVCVVGFLLYQLFHRTRLGLGMRAAISNPESARLSGIDVGRMQMIGWGLAAMVGTLAGALAAPKLFLEPNMMLGVLTYAFAAVIVGGLDSPLGAVVGGLAIGVTENLAGAYLYDFVGNDLKIAVPLALVFGILLVRPQGLFGRRAVARA